MTHENRSRLAVDTDGNWRLYTNSAPGGCTVLGTVSRDGETGALVVTEAGIYSMLNARVYRGLDQRKVKAALGIPQDVGRPAELDGGKRVQVYLDAESLTIAAKLGGGNVSEGIRLSLAKAAGAVFRLIPNTLSRTVTGNFWIYIRQEHRKVLQCGD